MACDKKTIPKFNDIQIAECRRCEYASDKLERCNWFGVVIGRKLTPCIFKNGDISKNLLSMFKKNNLRASKILPFKQLTVLETAENFGKAMLRFARSGFKMVSKETFIERQFCCTTCGDGFRCPYCGCLLDLKARLSSESGCPNKETYPNLKKFPPRNYWAVCDEMVSVIIPARNEPHLNRTIENVLKNATGKIEVITILDGYSYEVINDPRVFVLNNEEPLGRRKSINAAAKIAKGKYLFMLDAHCTMEEGWDTKLKCACEENTIVVSYIKALNPDNWEYLPGHNYTNVYLNSDFQEVWWNGNPPQQKIQEMMCFTGCAWLIPKDYYWQLGGYDESLGQYGQDGPEWSLKVWLDKEHPGSILLRSDVICGHLFETNKGGVLYNAKITEQAAFKNKMMAKYSNRVRRLVKKFAPVPTWDEKKFMLTVVEATDESASQQIRDYCFEELKKTIPYDNQIIRDAKPNGTVRSYLTYYTQLLKALMCTDAENVFIAEHDCLYPPEHFEFVPPKKRGDDNIFWYNNNIASLTKKGWVTFRANHLSTFYGNRELLIQAILERIDAIRSGWQLVWYEPGFGDPPGKTKFKAKFWSTDVPIVDIRHGGNFTGDRTGNYLEEIPYWGNYKELWKKMGVEI